MHTDIETALRALTADGETDWETATIGGDDDLPIHAVRMITETEADDISEWMPRPTPGIYAYVWREDGVLSILRREDVPTTDDPADSQRVINTLVGWLCATYDLD